MKTSSTTIGVRAIRPDSVSSSGVSTSGVSTNGVSSGGVSTNGAASPIGRAAEPRRQPVGLVPDELPRQFVLYRHADISGVSGVGVVCWGTAYADGKAVTRWRGMDSGISQISVWDHWEEVIRIHGHDGATELIWLDTGSWYPS